MKKIILFSIVLGVCLVFPFQAVADLDEGLVAYYPFNGNANDESGNGNHGIVNGATLAPDRFEKSSSAYRFDGFDDWIQINDSDSLDIGYKDYTIAAWIKTSSTKNWGRIFSKGSSGCVTGYMMRMGEYQSSKVVLENAYKGSCKIGFAGNLTVNDDKWHFVVGIVDRDVGAKVYVDGNWDSSQTKDTSSYDLSNDRNPKIGYNDVGNYYEPFDGLIDDVRIYHRALSEFEILDLYTEIIDGIYNADTKHWYQRFDDTMSWHMAKAHCESQGGYLVTITSEDEQTFVLNNLVSDSPNDCWIGASDESNEGKWQWYNDEKWKFDEWDTGQPDNCESLEHYAAIIKTDGKWQDKISLNNGSISCDCPFEFEAVSTICEWGDILGDLNGDNKVNEDDYGEFRKVYGKCKRDSGFNSKADFDEDGCVSYKDYRIWYSEYHLDVASHRK